MEQHNLVKMSIQIWKWEISFCIKQTKKTKNIEQTHQLYKDLEQVVHELSSLNEDNQESSSPVSYVENFIKQNQIEEVDQKVVETVPSNFSPEDNALTEKEFLASLALEETIPTLTLQAKDLNQALTEINWKNQPLNTAKNHEKPHSLESFFTTVNWSNTDTKTFETPGTARVESFENFIKTMKSKNKGKSNGQDVLRSNE